MSNASAVPVEAKWTGWLLFAIGILSIVAGAIVIGNPGDSLSTLAVIVGIFIVIDGVLELIVSLSRRAEHRGLLATVGVLTVIVGVILIRHPTTAVAVIALIIGLWLIAIGLVRFIVAFAMEGGRGWQFFVALVDVAIGVAIVSSPHIGLAALALLVGIGFILNGAGLTFVGWQLRKPDNWEVAV
jgi:uncharacterized membrane protein HdeD (DUF308 family)